MAQSKHEQPWTNNLGELFKLEFIPNDSMTPDERMNTITRLVLVVSFLSLVLGQKHLSLYILVIGLIVVLTMNRQQTITEPFEYLEDTPYVKVPGMAPIASCHVTYYPTLVSADSDVITSKNVALNGPANPKTLVPPPMPAPLADLDTWKANEWTVHSHINERPVQWMDVAGETLSSVNLLSSYQADPNTDPCYRRWLSNAGYASEMNLYEEFKPIGRREPLIEPFVSELQPGIYVDVKNQPILDNLGLLPDKGQPITTLYSGAIQPPNGPPAVVKGMEVYVEDPPPITVPAVKVGGYQTLDVAYALPQRYTKERLPKRYGDWNPHVGITPDGQIAVEDVKDLTGAQEMSEYYIERNKLNRYDVNESAPLYVLNRSAFRTELDVTNRFRSDLQESLLRKRNAEAWQRKMYPISTNQQRMLGKR